MNWKKVNLKEKAERGTVCAVLLIRGSAYGANTGRSPLILPLELKDTSLREGIVLLALLLYHFMCCCLSPLNSWFHF